MITIQNGRMTAKFSEVGAELKSLCCDGTEYIWGGDEKIWANSCPLVFPICSGLKDDQYILDGKTYTLGKHGFVRKKPFEVESVGENCVTFLLCADEETRPQFPFEFELRLRYLLEDGRLTVTYEVKNVDDRTMYFSIGAHEGYLCPEGIEEYDVIFPQKEDLISSVLEGNLIGDQTNVIAESTDTLPLKYDYFTVDALVFKHLRSRSATLRNRRTGRGVRVTCEGFPYFLIWTKANAHAPYVCLEPWCGISDSTGTDQNFKTKEGIEQVAAGETFTRVHTIEVF